MLNITSETLKPLCCIYNGPVEDPESLIGCIRNHDLGFEAFIGDDLLAYLRMKMLPPTPSTPIGTR